MDKKKQRIAIFGGTFNPVHNGHIHLCKECNNVMHFDKVILVPTNIPPHKNKVALVKNEERMAMLKLATQDDDLFLVSDIEYRLSGVSYTYNTIIQLKKQFPDADFFLIIGSDMLKMFCRWYHYKDILEEVTVVVGAREQREYKTLLDIKDKVFHDTSKMQIINIPIFVVSSTQIRKAIKSASELPKMLLNEKVLLYINEHGLYH